MSQLEFVPVSDAAVSVRRLLPYFLIAATSAIYLLPFVRTLTWNPDGGIYVYGAQRVLEGAVPSRDFIELQGPGSFYWLALFFKLFGISFLTARTVLLATGIATALLVFHLSKRTGATGLFSSLFVLVTSIPFSVINSPHYDSNLFALLSFAVFLAGLNRFVPETRLPFSVAVILFSSGFLAGVTSWILQQKGAYMAISYLLTLVLLHHRKAWRAGATVLAGYFVVIVIGVTLYAAARGLPDLIYANLIWPMSKYSTANSAHYGFILWKTWIPNQFSALRAGFPLPVAALLAGALALPLLLIVVLPLLPVLGYFWRREAFTRSLVPYWLAAYALWLSEVHRPDMGHLRNGCLLLMALFFILCENQTGRFPKQVVVAIGASLIFLGVVNAMGARSLKTPVPTRRGTLLAQQPDMALQFLLSHTKPRDYVFVYPYQPIYYFLADVENPTRFSNLMYGVNTDQQFRESLVDIDRKSVRYVLWDSVFSGEKLKSIFPSYRVPPSSQLILEPYFEAHYRQIGLENGFRILERIQP